MPVDWKQLLQVYVHDPPDKAFDIRDHRSRAADLAHLAFGSKEGWTGRRLGRGACGRYLGFYGRTIPDADGR